MTEQMKEKLATEFAKVVNQNSIENESNTPDWVIGFFLVNCLEGFHNAVCNRDNWYGGKQSPLESERLKKW